MERTHRLVAHGLVKVNDKYLVIKRSAIKRGKPNPNPEHWDIPGGTVELNELPKVAAIRETKEEVNLNVNVEKIIYEESNFDQEINIVFTTLIYETKLVGDFNLDQIKLDPEEHTEFKLIDSLAELYAENQKVVWFMDQIIPTK